jgi:hypothetical protein
MNIHPTLAQRSQPLALLSALLLAVAALLGRPAPAAAAPTVDHCGTITGAETWAAGPVHVVTCTVTIAPGATLTIGQGAIVKVAPFQLILVYGTLHVAGAPANPATITSLRDDSIGGDTNGDGAATTPGPTDWNGIQFAAATGNFDSVIDHAAIRYASNGAWFVRASPTISNSTFSGNTCPLQGDPASTPMLSGNVYSNNTFNGYCIGDGEISGSVVWSNAGTTYVIRGDIAVTATGRLTLVPGLVVKFVTTGLPVFGALYANGAQLQPVIFTTILDDSAGGDTNNNGSANGPVPSAWPGIILAPASGAPQSQLSHTIIRYGGSQNSAGLVLDGASPTIRYSDITRNRIGLRTANADPLLICNNFSDNAIYGLENTTPAGLVSAANQWWGHASGPGGAGPGSGDAISSGVYFTPWATEPCLEFPIYRNFLPRLTR